VRRQPDDEGRSASLGIRRRHVAAVSFGDRRHDREAEAGAAAGAALPARLGAPETLEQFGRVASREPATVVAHLDQGVVAVAPRSHFHCAAAGGMS